MAALKPAPEEQASALRAVPWKKLSFVGAVFAIPTGLRLSDQGCEAPAFAKTLRRGRRATLGNPPVGYQPQPGLRRVRVGRGATPLGLAILPIRIPRVAHSSQPWALGPEFLWDSPQRQNFVIGEHGLNAAADPAVAFKAFTLTELLVVLAVMAILVALLLPALSQAKSTAQTVKCANNLRQVGVAIHMYMADYSILPPFSDGRKASLSSGIFWYDYLARYTASQWSDPLYRCPTYQGLVARGDEGGTAYATGPRISMGSYGYNGTGVSSVTKQPEVHSSGQLGLGGTFRFTPDSEPFDNLTPLSDSEIHSPSDMIALGDAILTSFVPTALRPNQKTVNGLDCLTWVDGRPLVSGVWQVTWTSGTGSDTNKPLRAMANRHRGRFNIAFCDGHNEAFSPSMLFATNDAALCRWNNDHKPHRELVPNPW